LGHANSPLATRRGLLLGLALAITVMLRQVFLLFIPVLFAWLLWRSVRYQSRVTLHGAKTKESASFSESIVTASDRADHKRNNPAVRMMGALVLATGVLLLAIAPWTARNYAAFGRFVLLNTNAGFAFFWANHPVHGRNYPAFLPDWPSYVELIPPELSSLDEAELDQALLKRGFGFIRDDPGRYLVLSISRLDDYFTFWPSSDSGLISNVSRVFSFGVLWPLMALGLILHARRSLISESLILYLFVITYTAIHLLSWALIRYRLPVDAVLIIFAGTAIVKLQIKLAQRRANVRDVHIREGA
jgi:hypothetical protein